MSQLEIKKLITGFLLLAVFSSTLALIFATGNGSASSNDESDALGVSATLNGPEISKGAYSEKLSSETAFSGAASLNITDTFITGVADAIIAANPEGPGTGENGDGLKIPDGMEDILSTDIAVRGYEEMQVQVSPDKVHSKERYTKEDITAYFASFNEIIKDGFSGVDISLVREKLINQNDNLTSHAFTAGQLVYNKALEKAYALEVPTPLIKIHTKLLTVLESQRKLFESVGGYQNDPIKATLFVEKAEEITKNHFAALRTELLNPDLKKGISMTNESFNPFKIKTANAQWIVSAPDVVIAISAMTAALAAPATVTAASTQGGFWKSVLEFVKKLALEIIKDQLVHRLVYQVINWVQGGGKPQFITNWKQFFQDAGNEAAGLAISGIAPGLCRSFGPLVQAQLQQMYVNPPLRARCSLDQIVANVDAFTDSFSNGGWIAYGAMTLPGNNYYGSLYESSQIVAVAQVQAQEAKKAQAAASGGYKDKEVCVKRGLAITRTIPAVPSGFAMRQRADGTYENVATPGTPERQVTDPAPCVQSLTTNPGKLIGDVVAQTLGPSPIARIVSADDIIALASAVLNAGLTKLIRAGQKGLAGLINGGTNEPNNATPGSRGDTIDVCEGLTDRPEVRDEFGNIIEPASTELTDCRRLSGQAGGTTNTDTTAQNQSVVQGADQYIDTLEKQIENYNTWISASSSIRAQLASVGTACLSLTSAATSISADIAGRLTALVTSEKSSAQSLLSNVQRLRNRAAASQTLAEITAVTDELNAINPTDLNDNAAKAKDRIEQLTRLKNQIADNLLPNSTAEAGCSAGLTPLP